MIKKVLKNLNKKFEKNYFIMYILNRVTNYCNKILGGEMSKKLLSVLLALVLAFSLVACSQGKEEKKTEEKKVEEKKTEEKKSEEKKEDSSKGASKATEDFSGKLVGMVTDTGGIDDESFNQSSWEGLQKLNKDTKVKITYVQSKHKGDYIPNLNNLVDQNVDLAWGIGFLLGQSVETAAKQSPDKHFAIIDNAYEKPLPNVTGVVFKAQEPSYLVGYLAGLVTKTNKVGFVGGVKGVVIDQFDHGYRAGVLDAAKAKGKKIDILLQYADSFSDEAKGKSIATKMFSEGADIVFHAAGGVGKGVIEAAKEAGKFAIGVDQDQSNLAPKNVLTSALKRVDVAVYDLTARYLRGEKIGGKNYTYSLKEGAVGIPEHTEKSLYSKEVYDEVMKIQDKIYKGEIVPPYNAETFDAYINKAQ